MFLYTPSIQTVQLPLPEEDPIHSLDMEPSNDEANGGQTNLDRQPLWQGPVAGNPCKVSWHEIRKRVDHDRNYEGQIEVLSDSLGDGDYEVRQATIIETVEQEISRQQPQRGPRYPLEPVPPKK